MTSSPKWVCLCIEEEWDVRLCVDMRKANTAIIRNYYPIPTLDEVLYEVNGAKILSKLDLVEVYYKIVLNENSGDMATFSTTQRFFPYKRLISGAKMRLKNSRKLL